MNLTELSKIVSHALRHEPWLYELELDDEGWTNTEHLLFSLRLVKKEWANLEEKDLALMIEQSTKKRHELKSGKIRALYGHSTPQKFKKQLAIPPEILFHGTDPELVERVLIEGLKPMSRHYVHLSPEIPVAEEVGRRKAAKPTILKITAKYAHDQGISFYTGNDQVWLADYIPPDFIKVL